MKAQEAKFDEKLRQIEKEFDMHELNYNFSLKVDKFIFKVVNNVLVLAV